MAMFCTSMFASRELARQFSLPSDKLFGPSLTSPEMAEATSDAAWLAALLEVEAALAEAESKVGLVPADAAAAIRIACEPARFDIEQIGLEAVAAANPVVPLVKALTRSVPADVAVYVHFGATSQDILDTALMLIAKRALDLLLIDLDALAAGCARLARQHRDSVMPGRTLLQQAVPITFGLKAAGWLMGVTEATAGIGELHQRRLAVQLGGAAGTLSSLGDAGLDVAAELARSLGLAVPPLPWHSDRTRIAQLGSALAIGAGAAGKIALDIILLAQTEVGEVAEAQYGVSSAMPHKRNPVAAIEADACARGAAAQAALLLGSMRSEHERAAGAWQAEWHAVGEGLRLTAGAVRRARVSVEGLSVDAARMRSNLELAGGLVMSEAAALALAAKLGRPAAEEIVRAAAARVAAGAGTLAQVLAAEPAVTAALSGDELAAALDPARRVGQAAALIDRALGAYDKQRQSR
jgi:3-carboxy-cis,cis-muconate cycloisomerase